MAKGYRGTRGSGGEEAASVEGPRAEAPSNADLVAMVEAEQRMGDAGALRTADEIRESGVLEAFARLEGAEVSGSELNRSVTEDAVLVKLGLSKLTPEEIALMKEKAYAHPEVEAELPAAIEKKHYGSARHREYGALIEELTGGVLSAEEAMAMNPTGGLPGPADKEIPLAKHIEPLARHAMRHDATGFLLTRFGVGPGYGTKTSAMGRESNDPLAGQILGGLREFFVPSELPEADHVGKSGRFG